MENIWLKDGKFTALDTNTAENLPVEQKAAYMLASNADTMATLRKDMSDKVGTDAVKALEEKFGELKEKHVEQLQQAMEDQGKELSKLRSDSEKAALILATPKSFNEELRSVWAKSAKQIGEFVKGDSRTPILLDLKTEVTRASVADNTMSTTMGGVAHIPRRSGGLHLLFNQASINPDSNGIVRYWQEASQTDNSATVAESAAIPESAITWEEKLVPVQKIGDSIPVTREALEDVGFIESEINNFLLKNVDLQLDTQAILGDGTPPNFAGVDSIAPDWAGGAFTGLYGTAASIYDVLSTGLVQIANAGENSMFVPNVILMNPTDAELMRATKDADGNYVMPMWMTQDGMSVRGVRIIETSLVTANQIYIGDFTFGTMFGMGGTMLDIATQHGTDWLDDVTRIKATVRKALVIRDKHVGAFLHVASITAAQTALNA